MSQISRPGTVSKILWHFTGGPLWDSQHSKYFDEPKPDIQSFSALKGILTDKKLKVGNFREIISVAGKELETKKVCCVADIPIAHLNYHGNKYGKMAIGFKRSSLISQNFNPVFYIREKKPALTKFHDALKAMTELNLSAIELMGMMNTVTEDHIGNEIQKELVGEIERTGRRVKKAAEELTVIQSFFKTLKADNDFDDIFCEREWRNDTPFKFTFDDVVMIVLPREGRDGANYFSKLLDSTELSIPRNVSIVSWEDLIEH